ncbi:MlaD family protein [Nocardia flavorosea]|uniref:MCE family protein n=1 Tax=Nocardia flavorosea TaxID=53429 RepID=A0A846YUW0_9NOCA|nr:MlaD family protein [Nocardia flavorosea]NKY61032.1 MCE family protein [Nocardia flavorosea]
MLPRILGSRAVRIVTGCLLVAALAGGYLYYTGPGERRTAYCALMPDAIGLYENSKVTIRGIAVGVVRRIESRSDAVRVEFTVADAHRLTGAVSATTVADSIVADRDLAVLGESGGRAWDPGQCITRTLTPKSLTETMDSMARLSGQMVGGTGGEGLTAALRALDTATAGTGDQVGAIVQNLGAALHSPDVGIARIGRIIDALSVLSASVNRGWTDIESMLTRFPATFEVLDNQLFPMVVELGDGLRKVLPMLNDLSMLAGGRLLQALDSAVPLLHWVAANVGGLQELLTMVPAVASGFRQTTDPETGALSITYAPPKIALPQADAQHLCAALNALGPGLCVDSQGTARIDLAQLVLGSVAAR